MTSDYDAMKPSDIHAITFSPALEALTEERLRAHKKFSAAGHQKSAERMGSNDPYRLTVVAEEVAEAMVELNIHGACTHGTLVLGEIRNHFAAILRLARELNDAAPESLRDVELTFDSDAFRTELIQVAAMAAAWVDSIELGCVAASEETP